LENPSLKEVTALNIFGAEAPNRDGLFDGLPTNEITARYREAYSLGPEVGIDDVRRHVEVEGELTDKLILSPEEATRTSDFEEAYTELFRQFPWLSSIKAANSLDPWAGLMRPNTKVHEIGSGAGRISRISFRKGLRLHCNRYRQREARTAQNSAKSAMEGNGRSTP